MPWSFSLWGQNGEGLQKIAAQVTTYFPTALTVLKRIVRHINLSLRFCLRFERLLTIVVGGIFLVGLTACIAADTEFVRLIKETILGLVKAGYGESKILQIMHIYLYW
jgi:hypothetical protein